MDVLMKQLLIIISAALIFTACGDDSNPASSANSEYDATTNSLKDLRDGQTYKTVTIGSQTWMAENLNYEVDSSFCFSDEERNCAKYGRLYRWAEATSVCPDGWHLPSKDECNALFVAVGGASTAGEALKSASGWDWEGYTGNGIDSFGFSALPGGSRSHEGRVCNSIGACAYFWSSTEDSSGYAYAVYMSFHIDNADLESINMNHGLSVRCLKN